MQSIAGLGRPVLAAGSLLVVAGLLGCGNQYRPVIVPVTPTGPPQQGLALVAVVSAVSPTSGGVGTILDFAGDGIQAQINLGNIPLGFAENASGGQALTVNSDGTLNGFAVSSSIQTKNVTTSSLLPGVGPFNVLSTTGVYYIAERNAVPNVVGVLTGSPPGTQQDVPVPPGLVTLVGRTGTQRIYALSQLVGGEACNTPGAVTAPGVASGIETATNTISTSLPVGICPVYGLQSIEGFRTFILNRGSGTVTVIDSQKNVLDNQNGGKNTTFTVGAGPVYAELYDPASKLVTSNYDGNSISVIDVTTDVFDNDSPQFGTVHTIPVGRGPSQVTVFQDGTRAYVANSLDSTVSVVNLNSYTVEKVIPVAGTPRLISSIYSTPYGKVYVTSPDIASVTVIRTDTDTVETTIPVQGNLVDLRVQRQNIALNSQPINVSYIPGAGVPCVRGTPCYVGP
ncbi:MAG TPA: YncE family protein [Acidisarcina sp.]